MRRDEVLSHPDVEMAIPIAARRVLRRYRRYVTLDDLLQSAYVWAGEHPKLIEGTLPDPEAEGRDQRRAFSRLVRLFERALEGTARAEKAAASGYHPDDEAFYEGALLDQLLPAIWNEDVIHDPPQLDGDKTRGGTDPAEGGNWIVAVADIRRAWNLANLDAEQRNLLSLRYNHKLTVDVIASLLGKSKETVIRDLRVCLSRLAVALHGVRPLRVPAENGS